MSSNNVVITEAAQHDLLDIFLSEPKYELQFIFSNTIENAINACLRIINTKVRVLEIICKNKNDKLFIQITNSYPYQLHNPSNPWNPHTQQL